MAVRRIIQMDYLARGEVGHNQIYSLAIAREAARRGLAAEIWCARNCTIKSKYARRMFGEIKPSGRLGHISQAFWKAAELRKLVTLPEMESTDVMLFHTVFITFFISLSLALIGIRPKPKIIVVMRRGLRDRHLLNLPAMLNDAVSWLMAAPFILFLNRLMGVRFATDSEMITEELSKSGLKGVFTLPIPHITATGHGAEIGGPVIGYVGGARIEKGFDRLPEIAEAVLKKNKTAEFLIQAHIEPKYYYSQGMEGAKKRLRRMEASNPRSIQLVDRSLSYPEYLELMGKCSIILLPYRAELYGKGTSGILAEAVAMGKWIVAPGSTWMSLQKKRYGKIVEFDAETAEGIADAVGKCAKLDKNINRAKVERQIREWVRLHSPENYLTVLLDNLDDKRGETRSEADDW
ncbi:Uncharacterised protein [uncultured archaeon]|nr:Uncharacterised protein [uncultured archaeon]